MSQWVSSTEIYCFCFYYVTQLFVMECAAASILTVLYTMKLTSPFRSLGEDTWTTNLLVTLLKP